MQTLIAALDEHAVLVVNQFYDELSRLPKSRCILDLLSADELARFKRKQIQNFLALADPNLSTDDHAAMALRIGRMHAIAGLDKDEFVRSRSMLHEQLYRQLAGRVGGEVLAQYAALLRSDLAWQLKAWRDLQDAQQAVLLRVTRLVWEARSYTQFIDDLIDVLASHDEFAASVIGRADANGIFHFEAGSGGTANSDLISILTSQAETVAVRADHPRGLGAIGRAWRSGNVERIEDYCTDPLVEQWRELLMLQGFRSSVAIPIAAPGQSPLALLILASAYPGGFVGTQQAAFIDLLHTLLGCVVMRIPTADGRREAVPMSVRQRWAALVRTGAVELHYQPLLNLATWQAGRVEALARLRDGERLLGPDVFLSALGSDDLLALYAFGVDRALADRERWQRDGLDLDISINLPPAALNDIRYFEATHAALSAHGCASTKLTLEVLENESLSLNQGQRAILERFRALGVLLAQDDLGSAHSGLARLRNLPFDWVKIDRQFACFSGDGALDALRLIYQITRLGHALGKRVLAEGIDTVDQLNAMAILGADGAQGYVVAKPMDAAHLRDWMATWPARPPATSHGECELARLARFVVWEERIALVAAVPGVAQRLLGTLDAGREPMDAVDAFACSLCGFEGILPEGERGDALRLTLLRTRLTEGHNSKAYRAAVRELMRAVAVAGPL